jgi:hypothetical protein
MPVTMSDTDTGAPPDATASDGQPAVRQEYEIEAIRHHLGDLVNELGVRRDEWRPSHILRQLPLPFLLLSIGVVGLGAGVGIWQWRVHARERDSWLSRAQRLSPEAHRTIKAPNDVAKTSPSVARKIATTVAAAAAGMLTPRFLTRYPSQFTHAQAERMGSRSGHLNSDQTARASKRA